MAQTTVQVQDSIRFGSGILEIGDDVGSLVNVGAFRSGEFEESFDKVTIKSDNAGVIYDGIQNHVASLAAELMEINPDRLAQFMKGLHTVSTVAAAPISVENEAVTLTTTVGKQLAHKNAAGTEVSTIVVTNSGGTTTYVRNTDYVVSIDATGHTVIARIAAGAITSGQTVHVDYSYTPAAHRKYVAGGTVTLDAQVVRFTNTNAAGKKFQITIFKATTESGIKITFQPDDADDVNVTPIKMVGTCDSARTVGEQLFEIIDEQYAA